MILIAHEDDCYLITGEVPEHLKMQDHAGMHWACTCGGVKVQVQADKGEPHSMGWFKALVRFPEGE